LDPSKSFSLPLVTLKPPDNRQIGQGVHIRMGWITALPDVGPFLTRIDMPRRPDRWQISIPDIAGVEALGFED